MKFNPANLVLAAAILSLAACGGGGTSAPSISPPTEQPGGPDSPEDPGSPGEPDGPGEPDNPGAPDGPDQPPMPVDLAGKPIAELIRFAEAGVRSQSNGIIRNTATQEVDGRRQVVQVDSLPGYGSGLVTFRDGDRATIFTVAGEPLVTASTPNGQYTGGLELNYRMNENGQWSTMIGTMSMILDMETGSVGVDSISGNGSNVIELFGSAQYDAGRITGDAMRVHVRDGQGFILFGDDMGSVDALVATGSGKSVIFGTVDAAHANGFEMNGGLVLPKAK